MAKKVMLIDFAFIIFTVVLVQGWKQVHLFTVTASILFEDPSFANAFEQSSYEAYSITSTIAQRFI